ncbi:MAG: ABC transporter ATP-binding protein [Desulfobacterales bacterium]|jgi:peptide/nickel transport system ATP-binding protein
MTKLLETVDLVTNFYTYEGVVKALDKVSLNIDHGITFGLVGESGCGKSVSVRSMMRIIQEPGKIEGGQILFYPTGAGDSEAMDLLQQTESYMRALRGDSISMIFQEPNAALNPIMSIGDQVSESFLFHRKAEMCKKINADLNAGDCRTFYALKKVLQALYRTGEKKPDAWILKVISRIPILKRWDQRLRQEALRRSIEIIEKLGIANAAEIVRRYPHNLSGGMKQRIVIAIALACNPILLIADEATSNLDVTIQAQILELLKELKQKEISSVLLITHDLGIVAETCDRVGVMYAGNLCEVADIKDLFRSPRHPYTRALLNSVPRLSQEGELQSIEGSVPNLVTPPSGCRFHPRCPHAMEQCKRVFPKMLEVAKNHQVACYWATSKK